MEKKNEVVLEQSTNTHKIVSDQNIKSKDFGNSIIGLEIEGEGVVTHGEHGAIKTETKHVLKYVQQELNPVTKAIQNAFD